MRVMVIVKATPEQEGKLGQVGKDEMDRMLTAMGRYNEELVKAGIMKAGEGLHPSSNGKRIVMSGGRRTVVDGPFTESKELIAGFWIWQVKDWDEAVAWAKRCPDPMPGDEGELELRQIHEDEDFGNPEIVEQEKRLRAEIERQNR